MCLHAEVPGLALLRLMHVRVAFTALVLRRRRRGNDCRVHNRAFPEQQPLLGQVTIDGVEHDLGQLVRLQQAPKLQQRRRIRSSIHSQVDADEAANRLSVVDRVFRAFVGQTKALLDNVYAQHARQVSRRPTASFTLGIMRLKHGNQLGPRGYCLEFRKEAVSPRELLLTRIFQFRKTRLHRIVPKVREFAFWQNFNIPECS